MEGRITVCIVVGFLGLLSAALGFAAEAKRIKSSEVVFTSATECIHSRSPALTLGLAAAVALLIAQVMINVATGRIRRRRGPRQSNSNRAYALVCFFVSWFTFVLAFILLLNGAALNDKQGADNIYFSNYCYVLKPGFFAGCAALSVATVVLGIVYYLAFTAPYSQDPVCVTKLHI